METEQLVLQTTEAITETRRKKEFVSTTSSVYKNLHAPLTSALDRIFPQQKEENKVERTKRILGQTASHFADEQVHTINTDFQYLIDTWLDTYEKTIFDGMTLQNLLKGK